MQAVYLQYIPPALVVQPLDNTIHSIYIYPRDNAIGSPNTYLLDSVIQYLNNWGLVFKAFLYSIHLTDIWSHERVLDLRW